MAAQLLRIKYKELIPFNRIINGKGMLVWENIYQLVKLY